LTLYIPQILFYSSLGIRIEFCAFLGKKLKAITKARNIINIFFRVLVLSCFRDIFFFYDLFKL